MNLMCFEQQAFTGFNAVLDTPILGLGQALYGLHASCK